MYEPILMSKKSFEKLNKQQQDVLMKAAAKAEEYAFVEAKKVDDKMVDVYKKAGVEVVTMSGEQAAIADKSSYKAFADKVKGGKELLDMALSVE